MWTVAHRLNVQHLLPGHEFHIWSAEKVFPADRSSRNFDPSLKGRFYENVKATWSASLKYDCVPVREVGLEKSWWLIMWTRQVLS